MAVVGGDHRVDPGLPDRVSRRLLHAALQLRVGRRQECRLVDCIRSVLLPVCDDHTADQSKFPFQEHVKYQENSCQIRLY